MFQDSLMYDQMHPRYRYYTYAKWPKNTAQQEPYRPVAGEDVPGREVVAGAAALGVGLHVQQSEHAPVGEGDDAADTRARPRPRPAHDSW